MNAHRLTTLGVVAALALGAALWSTQTRKPQDESVSQALVPGLETRLNEVTQVRIRTAGDVVVATLQRGEDGWSLQERGGYAVDVSLLREYLLKVAQATRVEAKTSNPSLYDRLGVEPIEDAQASGAQLEIDGLGEPVKLIIGRNVTRGAGTYVRHAGDPQSWQASVDLAVERMPGNWLQKDLVDIAAGRITSVSVTAADGAKIEIARAPQPADADFVIANLPKGREAASAFAADATAGLLAALRFDDVFPATEAEPPAENLIRAKFNAEDGVQVALDAWQVDGKTRLRMLASLDQDTAAAFVEQAQAKALREHEALSATRDSDAAQGLASMPATEAQVDATRIDAAPVEAPLAVRDPDADRARRLKQLQDDVVALNARFEGWTFVLPPYKAEPINKSLEGYLKPRE